MYWFRQYLPIAVQKISMPILTPLNASNSIIYLPTFLKIL